MAWAVAFHDSDEGPEPTCNCRHENRSRFSEIAEL
jgi:hypothetical protein